MKNILNEVITEDNIQMLGEMIAIKALKTMASHSNGKLDYLYKGLLFDVYKRNTPNHKYSDGYDFAQTAMLFLWEHKGQKLGDYYGKNGKGKEYNLLYACYHVIDKALSRKRKYLAVNVSLDDDRKHFDEIPVEDKKEDDYTVCDTIISKMNLKQGELDTLNCYMAGMTYCEIARFLDVNFSTIYRRKLSLQKKYMRVVQL